MLAVIRVSLLTVLLLVCVAPARGTDPSDPCLPSSDAKAAFAANDNHRGVIDLYFFGADGATVSYYGCDGAEPTALGERSQTRDGYTPMYAATVWSCQRRTRRFAATVTLADGTVERGLTDIRTPSCAQRYRIYAPAHATRGHRVTVRVRDRWGIGDASARLCVVAAVGSRSCRVLRFVAAQRIAQRTFVPRRNGRWVIKLLVGHYRTAATVAVGIRAVPTRPLPRVLATGDSTMQGVDVALADELAGSARVLSDVHPGAGLSNGDGWRSIARHQAATRHASIVVLSIGADEGWPMSGSDGVTHDCCDAAWTTEYERRARAVLTAYRRHARVIVLTVVDPRDPAREAIVSTARNAMIHVAGATPSVRLLRADRLFTAHGYVDTIRYHGREIAVREPDGVHLNVAGTTIEAREAAPVIRELLHRPDR